ncbi:hypothetical protein LTR22_015607 [Elasticomyces elasticus]|nr:hypothetical protein LTR22_015607 [Elasticomyces elasticus]KAK4915013.1 putative NRPS-like protein biosynthetic cluster [Elasticomyces elasticus]
MAKSETRRSTSDTVTSTRRLELFSTLTELVRARASEPATKDEPIISYPSSGTSYVDFTPAQIDRLADKAAFYYESFIYRRISSDEPVQVVALLGPSTFAYFITLLALSRLGHSVLLLSTRLPLEAHVSLLQTTRSTVLLVDEAYADTSEDAQRQIPNLILGVLGTLKDFNRMENETAGSESQLDPARESGHIAYIIHSSGSTSLPRPNYVTHLAALGNSASPIILVGFVTLPIYHMFGLGCLFRSIMNKKHVYMYNAHLPLSNRHLINTLSEHREIQVLYTVPYVVKLMAESTQGTELLAGLNNVVMSGSACPKPIGDKLAHAGVMLVTHLGSTETGQLMSSARPHKDILEWDWLRPSSALLPYLRMEVQADQVGLYELVVLHGWPSKVVSNRPDGSYATKDLYARHPDWPHKNAWRYYARKDDTIVLSNGEKVNPLVLEGVAREDALVAEAVVFGAQKPRLGMFIVRSNSAVSDADVVDTVWSLVEAANVSMPTHARLSKEMISVLPPEFAGKVRTTDKGSLIRMAFYKDFAEAIDAMYDDVAFTDLMVLDLADLRAWLLKEFVAILHHLPGKHARLELLKEDTDVFAFGVDSLQASRIRSSVVRHIDFGPNPLGQNFVFDHPSVAAMACELHLMRVGGSAAERPTIEVQMQWMIDKYSHFESQGLEDARGGPGTHVRVGGQANKSSGMDCIVVTGATGSLGAHIVAQLVGLERVAKIVCLVRAISAGEAAERVKASLRERKIIVDWSKIEALASDLTGPTLGLSRPVYDCIANEVTSVIHCAWSVNFNVSLGSLQHCVRGTKHLLDLCLTAHRSQLASTVTPSDGMAESPLAMPVSFNFCSSISAVGNSPGLDISEELPESLGYAQTTGYAQSKLVAEHICMNAARSTGLTVHVLRIGQIIGDMQHGIWNAREAIPMILQSASTVGALPSLNEQCSWLPVDTVAGLVRDISLSPSIGSEVIHIVNPRTSHWTTDLLPMLRDAGLRFEIVEPKQWLESVDSYPDPVQNPPYRLMGFFAAKYGHAPLSRSKVYRTEKLGDLLPAYKQLPVLGRTMVELQVRYLQSQWSNLMDAA